MNIFKTLVLVLLSISLAFSANSQERVRIKRSEFKIKEDGFKDAWKAVRHGNSKYSSKADYRGARELYLLAYKYNENNAELNYKIGISYLYSDDKFQAVKYLKKAYDLDKEVTDDIHFQLARAYHMNYEFDNAIAEYKNYQNSVPERKLKRRNINIASYITECETGKSLKSHPVRAVVANVGKAVNTEFDDYAAVSDSREESIYFASRRVSKGNKKINLLDKKYSEDVYLTKKKGKDYSTSQLVSKRFTSKRSEAPLALSPDNKRLYLYKNNRNGNIFYTEQKDGKWSRPKRFSRVNSRHRETSISFTGDGKTLYFVSDRPSKGSQGGKDIYTCEMNAKGKWSKPRNLGLPINTEKNEECAYISKDGQTLYFASKGHPTMGGYDIFKSTKDPGGRWSQPENIGFPINTPDDDIFFSLLDNNRIGYISGNRNPTIGARDIYRVIFLGEEKELISSPVNTPLAFDLYEKKTIFKKMPDLLVVDSSIMLSGKILDTDTKKGIMSKIQFIDSEKSTVVATLLSDSSGEYRTRIPQKKLLGVEISARGYLFFLDVVDLKKMPGEQLTKDFMLDGLEVGAKVVLKNIFFETGKATLKDESFQQLNTVVEFMKENPTLTLEISGHTDNVGALAANIKLSQARAKAVVDYMYTQNIETSRLTYKGYGPNQPVAPNTTKDGKAKNRRVEFKITGK